MILENNLSNSVCLLETMMELSHSLTLNEDALNQIPEAKRPVFIFEWLRFLDKVLVAAQKVFSQFGIYNFIKFAIEYFTLHICIINYNNCSNYNNNCNLLFVERY